MAKLPDQGKPIARLDREDFLENYFDYKTGQHLSIIGETGNGKTYLANQLLATAVNPERPGLIMQMKRTDDTIKKFREQMKNAGQDWRLTRTWPPMPSMWNPGKPDGYVLAPRHTMDPDIDEAHHADVFRAAILDSYKKGKRIIFADEAYSLDDELGLGRYLITVWTKGRSEGCGLWAATQKPTHVPLWMYSQASHLFLDYPSDKRARDRYREIGGMDPEVIERAVWQASEEEYAFVYVKPDGRRSQIAIVGP